MANRVKRFSRLVILCFHPLDGRRCRCYRLPLSLFPYTILVPRCLARAPRSILLSCLPSLTRDIRCLITQRLLVWNFCFDFVVAFFSDQIERIVEEVSLSIDLISRFRSLARDIWCLVNLEIGCLEFSFRFCRWIFVISFWSDRKDNRESFFIDRFNIAFVWLGIFGALLLGDWLLGIYVFF